MSEQVQAALLWCPCPDTETARQIAKQLLSEKLIACGNIIPSMISVFEWQGEVHSENEVGLLLKTTASLLEQATARTGELHPYDTPAIVGWHCDQAHPMTLDWLGDWLGDRLGDRVGDRLGD